ncbi:DUF6452 family protein [Flavobacterium sp.]|uniref:DUF6452 family protein n=1 Tax=Flavobacterium sp. TaxID=239 RepID=UPI00248A515D|nr:DUF6452 family protein [Flavobacterium sp.]MDI1317770.1 DUF6452 family protein [Flavobacterium sp.]
MKKIVALILLLISLSSCEKDDICVDETTPRLIIEFYDITNPAALKPVLNLTAKGEGAADFMVFNTSLTATDPNRYLFNGSKLALPLKLNDTITKYSLVLNSTSLTASNEDFLEFHYTPENVFVSRACGYKTIFQLNSPGGVLLTDSAAPDTFWIQQNINIQKYSITTEDETHIKIYF